MFKAQNKITSFFSPRTMTSQAAAPAATEASKPAAETSGHDQKRLRLASSSSVDEGVGDSCSKENGSSAASSATPSRSVPSAMSQRSIDESVTSSPGGSLTREQRERTLNNQAEAKMRLLEKEGCFMTGLGVSWFRAVAQEFSKDYYKELSTFVAGERQKFTIYPPACDVFSWTRHCAFNEVKVVILGQDPYHGPRQAHGLCFSVQKGVQQPPSLVNIFKELESDISGFKAPVSGDLTGWAKQGVLLLNTVLTVRQSQANSHAGHGWEKFTDAIISALSTKRHDLVFLLWGKPAQDKQKLIDKKKHHILCAPHPSPLSVYRGFYGCKHFSQANVLLKAAGYEPIDWSRL